jgi:L-aminopeptidase/D-esterase-like protein
MGAIGAGQCAKLTDVSGITVGHAEDLAARTGVTVVLCGSEGAVAAVDVRGAAPGTRETDLLEPGNLVERVHAIVLTGGSVFGLDSACGAVRYLEEHGVGFDTGAARVPIVPAAVIYDLGVGDRLCGVYQRFRSVGQNWSDRSRNRRYGGENHWARIKFTGRHWNCFS